MEDSVAIERKELQLANTGLDSVDINRIARALVDIAALPYTRDVERLLGTTAKDSYKNCLFLLEERLQEDDTEVNDPVAYYAGIDQEERMWFPMNDKDTVAHKLELLEVFCACTGASGPEGLQVLAQCLAEYETEHASGDSIKEEDRQGCLWDQLVGDSNLGSMPDLATVRAKCPEHAESYRDAIERLEELPDLDYSFEDALDADRRFYAPTICRKAELLILLADAGNKENAVAEYERDLLTRKKQKEAEKRQRRNHMDPIKQASLQYGIFKINTAANVPQWKQRLQKMKSRLEKLGLIDKWEETSNLQKYWSDKWEDYASLQKYWVDNFLPAKHNQYLPAKRFPRITEDNFLQNWLRLKALCDYIRGTGPSVVGYPCLNKATPAFPYTDKELREITGRKGTRYQLCQYITENLATMQPKLGRALAKPDFSEIAALKRKAASQWSSTASVPQKVEQIYHAVVALPSPQELHEVQAIIEKSPQKQVIQDATSVRQGLKAIQSVLHDKPGFSTVLQGTPYPLVDRLTFLWNQCRLPRKMPVLTSAMTREMNATSTVEQGCQWLRSLCKLSTTTYVNLSPQEKYVVTAKSLHLPDTSQSAMEARYAGLTQDKRAALIATKNVSEGVHWFKNIDTPQPYQSMSPSDKWAVILMEGMTPVGKAPSVEDIRKSYNCLQVSDVMALSNTASLDQGIAWVNSLKAGTPVKPAKPATQIKPSCRLTQTGRCRWYLGDVKTTRAKLIMAGFSDDILADLKMKLLKPHIRRPLRAHCLMKNNRCQWKYGKYPVTRDQLLQIGYSQSRLNQLRRNALKR